MIYQLDRAWISSINKELKRLHDEIALVSGIQDKEWVRKRIEVLQDALIQVGQTQIWIPAGSGGTLL